MMSRIFLALGILLTSIASPLTAHAYVTPEEALDDEEFTTQFFEPPPSPRTTQDVVNDQQERSAQRRAAEQAELNPSSSSSIPMDDGTHNAAPDEETDDDEIQKLIDALNELQGDEGTTDGEDESDVTAEELRLLQRIRSQEVSGNISARSDTDEVLHSGAPLSDTGPATILLTLAVVGAISETLRRVFKADKLTR